MTSPDPLQLLRLFQKVAPDSFFEDLCEKHGWGFRSGIYRVVVVWLMIWQRLQGNQSLAAAVQYLLQGWCQGFSRRLQALERGQGFRGHRWILSSTTEITETGSQSSERAHCRTTASGNAGGLGGAETAGVCD